LGKGTHPLIATGKIKSSVRLDYGIGSELDCVAQRDHREDGERHLPVEQIIGIDVRHVLVGTGVGRHFEIGIDAEDLAHGNRHVGQAGANGSVWGHDRWKPVGRISWGPALAKPRSKIEGR
jgi:hypothetical protein